MPHTLSFFILQLTDNFKFSPTWLVLCAKFEAILLVCSPFFGLASMLLLWFDWPMLNLCLTKLESMEYSIFIWGKGGDLLVQWSIYISKQNLFLKQELLNCTSLFRFRCLFAGDNIQEWCMGIYANACQSRKRKCNLYLNDRRLQVSIQQTIRRPIS